MFHPNELRDELQALKVDVARLVNTTGAGLFEASSERADAFGDQVKAVLSELGETLSEQEGHLEKTIAERPLTSLAAAFALGAIAGFLLMLELSAYFVLVQIWSAISAAAILGALNFVIAAILFVIAARPPAGRELELANEIHGSSIEALQLEARALQAQVSGTIHHPLNGILPLLIVPLITIIINGLKKKPATSAAKPS